MEDSAHTPFQRLQFLVRDWSFPYDAPYGTEGGVQILDRRLQVGVRRAGGPGGEESCRQTDIQTDRRTQRCIPRRPLGAGAGWTVWWVDYYQ